MAALTNVSAEHVSIMISQYKADLSCGNAPVVGMASGNIAYGIIENIAFQKIGAKLQSLQWTNSRFPKLSTNYISGSIDDFPAINRQEWIKIGDDFVNEIN